MWYYKERTKLRRKDFFVCVESKRAKFDILLVSSKVNNIFLLCLTNLIITRVFYSLQSLSCPIPIFFPIDMKWERQMKATVKRVHHECVLKEKGCALAHLIVLLGSKPLIEIGEICSLLLRRKKWLGDRICSRSSFQWVFWRLVSLLLGDIN